MIVKISQVLCGLMVLALARPVVRAQPARTKAEQKLRAQAKKLYVEGRKLFALGQFRAALSRFERAYRLVPLPGFLFNMGQCHRLMGDCKKAKHFYRGYLHDDPGSPNTPVVKKLIVKCEQDLKVRQAKRAKAQAFFLEGKNQLVRGAYRQALTLFQKAYQANAAPGYLFSIAQAYRGLKQWAKAIELYEAYLADHPGTPKEDLVKGLILNCNAKLKALQRQRDKDRIRRGLGTTPNALARSTPVYKRWWFWTIIVVAVGAGVGAGVWYAVGRDTGTKLPTSDVPLIDWR